MKNLYLTLFLFASLTCEAQETYFLKADQTRTTNKDSALLVCSISAKDPASGTCDFKEVFASGEVYRSGKTSNPQFIVPDIDFTEYYLSGKPLKTIIYKDRKPAMETIYYPDGQVYLVKELSYDADNNTLTRILTCNARDGKALTVNGNGTYVTYLPLRNAKLGPERFLNEEDALFDIEQGPIADGLKHGTWTGTNDAAGLTYTEEFDNGRFVSGLSTDRQSAKHNYTQPDKAPEFRMGIEGLYRFIGNNMRYPQSSRLKGTQGKVFITFVVGIDGAVNDIGILRSPDAAMAEEAARILSQCPRWAPGERHGTLVRQRFTVPINFVLDK
ncbi:energy transducer TonB [Mucilaginibacter myungsuensis]|uniref:Energy transducer TonB n=1 Tax=Mucilaginibacter myungsuensis TaxID=649104 RepID=A0A929L053_9SPHI|nr:energy transducer TonB [Mucilaginibacter myungsuensis]MBE9663812.1 energy transducer TonB [Mucilaginibacter myungsuensis]MDN3598473.1 energy transducer TonB [Mucilaginibacter myungsuensis]